MIKTNKTIAPKSILITGASSGIGAALAAYYAAPGVTLFLSGRDDVRLALVAADARAKGAAAHTKIIDVTDRHLMDAWIGECHDSAPLDLVIANAGISGGTGGGGMAWLESEQKIFDVNVQGVLNTIFPAIERMVARKHGQIGIVSSLAGVSGWPGSPAYSATKAAVRVYGEALHGALAPHGVGVSAICPGFIRTAMTAVNPYKMPFMMDADRAAGIIARGLAENKIRIAFPWQTYAFVGFLGLLPAVVCNALLKRFPPKPLLPQP